MPYGTIALDSITSSGTLAVTGNVSTSGSILNSSGNPILKQTGGILQVIQTTLATTFSTTSTTFTDLTGMSATITPSSASSKIFVLVYICASNSGFNSARINLLRGAVTLFQPASGTGSTFAGTVTASNDMTNGSFMYLDSPNTTSATTYKLQCATNAGTLYFNTRGDGFYTWPSSMILMEVAG